MSRDGIVRRTTEGYEIVFERRLAHPPERVWTMITDPSQIPKWYVRSEIEPRPGGRLVEHHDHVGLSTTGRVTRYEPPRVFEHTWWGDGEDEGEASIVRWELFPDGEGTRLVLTTRLRELDEAAGTLTGWHVFLDVLEDVLDGGDPSAHAPPRGAFRDGAFIPLEPGRGRWATFGDLDQAYQNLVQTSLTQTPPTTQDGPP